MKARGCLRRTLASCLTAGFTLSQLCIFTTPGRAEGLDLVMSDDGSTTAEIGTRFDLGPLQVLAEHREYLTFLTLSGERNPTDAVARSTSLSASAQFDVAEGATLPVAMRGEHEHFGSGRQGLDISLESGLRLPGLRIAARFDMSRDLGPDTDASQAVEGRLSIGFTWLGGRHEGSIDYEMIPTGQATAFAFGSSWSFGGGTAAALDFSHRPLNSLSELEVGLNQRYGPFTLTSDFSADSLGDYALGFGVSLNLAPTPAPSEWRLSTLLAQLTRAARQSHVQDSFGILSIDESD